MVTPTETRFGRTALIVLAISLSMCGALLALGRFGPKDEYDQGVLKILAITVGVVGSIWAFVLLVRGVKRDEPMVLPFAIFLIVFAGLSIPLIQTWDTKERGAENGWYFFHFACVSLIVPLLTISFLFATPLFAWKFWRARRGEEALRAGLKWRAWRALFLAAGVFFAAVFPVSFYIYGGTMSETARGEHWTTKVVRVMPRFLGDIGFRTLEWIPEKATNDTKGLLISRGLVTADFLIETIESGRIDRDVYFNHFARNDPTEALQFARKHFCHYPPTLHSAVVAAHFAQFASDSDVREYLTPERYNALTIAVKFGLSSGLLQRANAKDLVPDAEKLCGGDGELSRVALTFLMKHADDVTAKRVYVEMIERQDDSLRYATSCLIELSRASVIATGISQPDINKQQRVLQAVLHSQSFQSTVLLMRNRNDAAFRLAILRAQDNPDIDNRVMNALIIHQLSNAMTPILKQKYGMRPYGVQSQPVTRTQLWKVDLAERNVLIAQARDLMRKW